MSDNRADSSYVQTGLVQEAFKDIRPPSCVTLHEKHMPFWFAIVQARHKWTEIDLFHAANLARTLYMIEEETALLELEGSTVWGGKNGNTKIANHRHALLENLTRRASNLSQKLQVHTQAVLGNPRDNVKKNTKKQEAFETYGSDEDDLIAKPVN